MQLVQKFTVPVSHICTMSLLQVTVSHTQTSMQCQTVRKAKNLTVRKVKNVRLAVALTMMLAK